jgi:hypothetical protein
MSGASLAEAKAKLSAEWLHDVTKDVSVRRGPRPCAGDRYAAVCL